MGPVVIDESQSVVNSELQKGKSSLVYWLPGVIFLVFICQKEGTYLHCCSSVGNRPEDVLSPKYKYLPFGLPIRPKPNLQCHSSCQSVCDIYVVVTLALNDLCFQFKEWCSLLWGLLLRVWSTENSDKYFKGGQDLHTTFTALQRKDKIDAKCSVW